MKKLRLLAVTAVFLLSASPAPASNIKLIPASGVDATNLKSLVRSVTAGCANDQEKMEALWAFITRHPFYHWAEAREGRDAANEYGVVYDPVKAFNVYGTVICYQVADLLGAMAWEAGIPARTRGFPYHHRVMEAFFNGGWHLFDAQYDCQAIYYKSDGKTIASLDEVDADPERYLFHPSRRSVPFFQFEKFGGNCWPWETRRWVLENWYGAFKTGELYHSRVIESRGHQMLLSLHRGEKLIRYWDNQGKWFCTPEMYAHWLGDKTQRWIALGPHDPRDPRHTYANGLLLYRPDWKANEANFLDGVYSGENYRLVNGRISPDKPGKAWVLFRVSSPYLIAGHPNRLGIDGDSDGGAVLRAEIDRAEETAKTDIEVSTDNGVTWRSIWRDSQPGRHPVEVDFTSAVEGAYGYLLRVNLEARNPKKVSFGGLELRTGLFYSPVLLPGLGKGENRFTVELSEPSEQFVVEPDFTSMEALKRYCSSVDNLNYDSHYSRRLRPPEGQTGSLVLEVAPPGDGLIHQMTIYGSWGVDPEAHGDSLRVLYAEDAPENWHVVWETTADRIDDGWRIGEKGTTAPPLAAHWRCDKSFEIKLKHPRRKCYVKYEITRAGRLSLNNAKVYGYWEPEHRAEKPAPEDIVITHSWREDKNLRSRKETLRSNRHIYVVNADGDSIVNEAVTIEVVNKPAR